MNGRTRIRLHDDLSLGPLVRDVDNLIQDGSRDNANMSYNPETLHKYTADSSLKRYALTRLLPGHLSELHLNGDLHIHDLEYFAFRPLNCLQHDIRFIIKNGLKVDGTGLHTSAAKPAKNLEVLVNHSGQLLAASQVNMSGGQGLSLFNIFFAPYVRGLSYERIKQAMQMWVFNQNMSYVSRGGQSVFSTIGLEFDIPGWLEEEIAYGSGGTRCGVYGDYEEEAQTILRAFTETMMEGDGYGKPHMFPNSVYYLRDSSFKHEELLDNVMELSSKFSIPYFAKEVDENGYHNVMGCRTRLNTNWTGDPDKDTLRTGNLAYVSLNLPRYAISGNFWETLDEMLDASKEILLLRRKHSERLMNNGLLKFLTQKGSDGNPYYRIENSTMSFGVVGLSDALQIMEGADISNSNARKKGHIIMRYINDYAKRLTEETGFRWTVLQTPAESTCGKFAREDRRRFGKRAPVHGERGGYYYVNSTHTPVDSQVLLTERIGIEHNFHKETAGGHIMHLWFGESYTNPEALESLTKKIYKNSNVGFWTYTSAFSLCKNENKVLKGIHSTCDCGSETEIYDRITGYLQRVDGWNAAKQQEFKDRRRY